MMGSVRELPARPLASLLAAAMVLISAVAMGGSAHAASPIPRLVRASLVRPATGAREPAIGTAVRLGLVRDIAFASTRVGYALGGPEGSTFPLRTTNGGRRWSIDGPALVLPVADGPAAIGDIAARSATEVYAYSGTAGGSSVAVTTDGGGQWWRAFLGQSVVAVSQRGGELWALAAGSTGSSSEQAMPPLLLYVSRDGGRQWTYRSTLTGMRGWAADLARPSARTAFALVSGYPQESARAGGIVETTNGGATWTVRRDPCEDTLGWTQDLAAATVSSLWLFCGGQPSTGIEIKLVERSQDAGRTWTLVASNTQAEHGKRVPAQDIPLVGGLPDTGTTGGLVVTSPADAWLLLTGSNDLWKTNDGGHAWTQGAPSKVQSQFPQVLSLAQKSLFVKTQNALWASSASGWKLRAGTSKPY